MADRSIDIVDLDEATALLAAECELSGKRTVFLRHARPVAILISHDEYLSLTETVAIASRDTLRGEIEAGDDQARRGELLLPEDLLVE